MERLNNREAGGAAGFGASQLFITDSRLALALLNHARYQALNRVFGVSREQANVLTFILVAGAAEGAYEATRRIGGMLHVSGVDAAFGSLALRHAALGVAGPSNRAVPGFGSLVALAVVGGLAAPGLRRTAHKMRMVEQRLRATEHRVRLERIKRYSAARERLRRSAA
jgi:hypothetical protein